MALNTFEWENGTLVEPAKVEIGGVSYDVTDAQYEGSTPLSASNLNLMQSTLLGNVKDDLTDDTKIPSVKAVKSGIMESGSNDNGNYIKFYDGTLICYADKYGESSLFDYWGQFKRGQVTVTFPQTFIANPFVNTGLKNAESFAQLSVSAEDIKISGFTAKVFKPNNATSVSCELTYIAIGKWK